MDWKIGVHERPDLDAICGIWLLKKFGEAKFPGIGKAKVKFFKGEELIDGKSAEDWENQGVILVDIGRGKFDHHPASEYPEECATTLIAKYLDVDDDPALEQILKFVRHTDLQGALNIFDLSSLVKAMHKAHPRRIVWPLEALEAKYQDQLAFFDQAAEEHKKAEIEEIRVNNRLLKVLTAISDCQELSRYARSHYGGRVAVVIQKRTSGNVQIFTNQRYGLRLNDTAQMIRLEEQKVKGEILTSDWQTLAAEGAVKGAEEWYFHYNLQSLLNGSLTFSKVPPTNIPLEKIKALVKLSINYTYFPCGKEPRSCSRKCDYYEYGLHRCRKLRFQLHQS